MSDRELLEAAASAARIVVVRSRLHDPLQGNMLIERNRDTPLHAALIAWNPLTDDGDALRLAVMLGMSVDVDEREASSYAYAGKAPRVHAMELWRDDRDAATRRAIVRAAASCAKDRSPSGPRPPGLGVEPEEPGPKDAPNKDQP